MLSLYRIGLCICSVLVASASLAQVGGMMFGEEPKVSYTGTRELVTSEGTITMKEYHAPKKQRVEMAGPQGPMVMINRRDQGEPVAWMLMPSMKMVMTIPITQFTQQMGGEVKVIEQSKVGSETLDGHKVDKYKSIFEDAQGNRGGGFYWITQDGIPLKMDMVFKQGETKHRIMMQLKDLEVGPQDEALFEIPAGYSSMPSMGKLFSTGMSSGATNAQDAGQDAANKAAESGKLDLKSLLRRGF